MVQSIVIKMQQVHDARVVRVFEKDDGQTIKNCDALITNDHDLTLCVRVADCLPIMVADKKGQSFGIIHAGWRGLNKKIISKTIAKMKKEFGVNPKNLVVWIGPHICVKHYEVKSDVSDKFRKYPDAVKKENGKEFLDLGLVAIKQLIGSGVRDKNIQIDEGCTYADKSLFSYRRGNLKNRNLYILNVKSVPGAE